MAVLVGGRDNVVSISAAESMKMLAFSLIWGLWIVIKNAAVRVISPLFSNDGGHGYDANQEAGAEAYDCYCYHRRHCGGSGGLACAKKALSCGKQVVLLDFVIPSEKECAGLLKGLGYEATFMVESMLLRGFDKDMVNLVQAEMKDKVVKCLIGKIPVKVSKQPNGKLLIEQGEFDTVLVATGRKASSEELNPSAAGLRVHPESFKFIINAEQTNERPELTPLAIQAGKLLAGRLYNDIQEQINYDNVATTVFSPLEYGCVGFTEEEAINR
ncbi:hypothetical protein ACI65C_005824 [Semiaphis heraclei]